MDANDRRRLQTDLGQQLRLARKAAALTQAQVSLDVTGSVLWDRSHLSKVETGKTAPSKELVGHYETRCGIYDKRLSLYFESLGLEHLDGPPERGRSSSNRVAAGPRIQPETLVSIEDSGLFWIGLDFYHAIPWAELLQTSQQLDLFVTYARSWRRSLTRDLRRFADRPETVMRVLLPSTDAPRNTAIPEIAKRAGQSIATLTRFVSEAIEEFQGLGAEVWLTDTAQLFSLYRFDSTMVVSMYNHQRGQSEGVPTLVLRAGGTLYDWFQADYEALLADKRLAWRQG